MVRTQIQLTEQQYNALKNIARARGLSMAEVIRQGIDKMIGHSGPVYANDRVMRAINAAGRFRAAQDLSVRHDHYLAEAFAE